MGKIEVSKVMTLSGHRDCVYTVEQSPVPGQFFSAGGDGLVVSWEAAAGGDSQAAGKVIARLPASVYALCYLPGRHWLAVGHNGEGIHLLDLEGRREIHSAKITSSAIFDIKSLGSDLFIGCGDGSLVVFDLDGLRVRRQLRASTLSLRSLALHPGRRELAAGYSDQHIRIFDLDNYDLKHNIAAHQNSVFTLQYSPDYQYLLSGSRDAHLKIWKVDEHYALHEAIVAHLFTINDIKYSEDQQYFATCSKDKSVKVWDAAQFKLLKVIDRARHAGHGTSVNKLLWTNQQLISCSDDRSISVWDIRFPG